jgi:cytochrome c5
MDIVALKKVIWGEHPIAVALFFAHVISNGMNKTKQPKALVQKTFTAVIAAMVVGGLASILYADEPKPAAPQQTNSVTSRASSPATNAMVPKTQLTGVELYSIHCNRCHQERYPTERTGAQWKTIMLHMQVRANIPVSQARLILQYLQENSGR